MFGDHLRKDRGVALPGILHAEPHHQRAVARKRQHGAFGRRAARMLEQAADAEAAIFAAPRRLAAALLEAVVVGKLQRLVEHRLEIAAVIGGADRGLVRHLRFFDQVAPPQLHRIDAGHARRLIDHALEHVACLRPPGAAIGRGRQRVGEDALGRYVDQLDVVHARQAAGEIPRRNIGADRAHIGAEIADVAHAQRQKFSLLVERELGLGVNVARLVVGQERFRPRRHPVNRPAEFLGADQNRDVFRIRSGLEPECAADVFGDDVHALRRQFHDADDVLAHRAGALRAGARRVGIGRRIVARGGAARLHRIGQHALINERHFGDVLRRGKSCVDRLGVGVGIGIRARPIDRDIAGRLRPQLRRAVAEAPRARR